MVDGIENYNNFYNSYLQKHPECRLMKKEYVYEQMLKEGVITKDEYNKFKSGQVFSFTKSADKNPTEIWGGNFTKNTQKPSNYIEKPKNYHPVFQDLELDAKGKIDMNQFSLESLKKRYGKEYNVTQDDNNNIIITDKKTNKPAMRVCFSKFFKSYSFQKLDRLVDVSSEVVCADGKIDASFQRYGDGRKVTTQYYDGDIRKVKTLTVVSADENTKVITDYNKSGQKTSVDTWIMSASTNSQKVVKYTNNKPWKIYHSGKTWRDESTITYPLVDDLVKDLRTGSTLSDYRRPVSSLSEDVLKRITGENGKAILNNFEEKTGVSLSKSIKENVWLSDKEKSKLLLHIDKCYAKSANPSEAGKYIGERLLEDVNSGDVTSFKSHLDSVTKENLQYIMTEYRRCSQQNNWQKADEIDDKTRSINDFLPSFLEMEEDGEKVADEKYPVSGLLTAIKNMKGMSVQDKNKFINKFVGFACADLPAHARREINKDISSHKGDMKKVEVDIYRAINYTLGDNRGQYDNPAKNAPYNGKFDSPIKQGHTGDCWLLAGLNSLLAKTKGRKAVESLYTIDKNTGIITVNFAAGTYQVTPEEIEYATRFSSGDEDARIIEIAFDKFMKDYAYSTDEKHLYPYIQDEHDGLVSGSVDLNGNDTTFFYNVLFGDDRKRIYSWDIDVLKEDFNNPDLAFSFDIEKGKANVMAYKDGKSSEPLQDHHAYSIVGSDEKNIILVNPWNSEEKFYISREEFKKQGLYVQACAIPDIV